MTNEGLGGPRVPGGPHHPAGHVPGRPLPAGEEHELLIVTPPREVPRDHAIHRCTAALHGGRPLHRLLTDAELRQYRAPTDEHLSAIYDFARQHGFRIVEVSDTRGDIRMRAPVGAINAAFGVTLNRYTHHGVGYHGHDGPARMPTHIQRAKSAVLGLHGAPHHRRRAPAAAERLVSPQEIIERYRFPDLGDARPGRIAVLEFGGGYYAEDLDAFEAGTSGRVRAHRVPGSRGIKSNRPMPRQALEAFARAWVKGGKPEGATKEDFTEFVNTVEVTMDIELVASLLPDVPIDVYFGPPGVDGWWRTLWAVLGHPVGEPATGTEPPAALSISWSWPEVRFGTQGLKLIDHALHVLTASGVTVCCSSGDDGSSGGYPAPYAAVHFPASSPHAFSVGATMLTDVSNPVESDELAWSTSKAPEMASSGGMSGYFPLPAFQQGIHAAPLPTTWRADPARPQPGRWVPDASALGGFQVRTWVGGIEFPGGGTSAATPMWAALVARMSGILGRRLGPVHHLLYSSRDTSVMRDVVKGSNDITTIGGYKAGRGWDPCTGTGVPNGEALLQSLSRWLADPSASWSETVNLDGHYHGWALPGEGVVLLSEREDRLLYGPLYAALVPLLSRGLSTQQILLSLGQWPASEVLYAIDSLRDMGVVANGATPSRASEGIGDSTGLPPGLDPIEIRRGLEAHGVHPVVIPVAGAPRQVVFVDDYLRVELLGLNRMALRSGTPWLLAKPVGEVSWGGPWFVTGQTGCWACLGKGLTYTREIEGWLARRLGLPGLPLPPQPTTEPSFRAALSTISGCVASFIRAGEGGHAPNSLWTLDSVSGDRHRHRFSRRPQCPECGDPQLMYRQGVRPPTLQKGRKKHTTDGGHRIAAPREVVNRLERHVDPITGVIREIEEVPVEGAKHFHVFLAGNNPGRSAPTLGHLRAGLRSRSCGKGKSEDQARASALAEAVERYSAQFQGDEPRVTGSLASLGELAVDPRLCLGYSARQYASRHPTTGRSESRRAPELEWVPPPFEPNTTMEWTPAWPLGSDSYRLVPTMYAYYGYPVAPHEAFCPGDSNGAAAGNSIEEAVLQGFLELVERDAVGIWWYNRLQRPGLDLESVDDDYTAELRGEYRALGRDLWVLDLTTDLEIPVLAAVSRRVDGPSEGILFGFGAHLDPEVALGRALTELNQMVAQELGPRRSHLLSGALGHWLQTATLNECEYLAPTERTRTLSSYSIPLHDDLRDDVHWCADNLRNRGLDLLVVDQTRPDIGMPVVKVVVPGLRHFRPRFGPGRLYDVPTQMGWQSTPLPEEALNPIPFML